MEISWLPWTVISHGAFRDRHRSLVNFFTLWVGGVEVVVMTVEMVVDEWRMFWKIGSEVAVAPVCFKMDGRRGRGPGLRSCLFLGIFSSFCEVFIAAFSSLVKFVT